MATFTHVTTDSALTSYATFDSPPQVLAVPNITTPIRYPLVPIETGEYIELPPELSSRVRTAKSFADVLGSNRKVLAS